MDAKEILRKYESSFEEQDRFENMSKEYEIFRNEILERKVTSYEGLCNLSERIISVKPSDKDREQIVKSIEWAHLNITPEGAASFSALVCILIIFFGIIVGAVSYLIDPANFMLLTMLTILLTGAFLIKPLTKIPNSIAVRFRLEASNQMVMCILYVVIYMRHTSNLEHAIKFAGEHIGGPLSLDLKKILWDVETEKFLTIKESLDSYLIRWREYNSEFVEAFHLIEGSLYEGNESRRIEVIEKALQVMLEGTYENMLHYAHNLQSPITVLHMLGVILPVLGLVVFPLIGSFLGGSIRWYHISILYNFLLPIAVYFIGNNILAKRPSGYGGEIRKLGKDANSIFLAVIIGGVFVAIGFLPVIVHYVNPNLELELFGFKLMDYKDDVGPYGVLALILSLLIPLGMGLGVSVYYKMKTKNYIQSRLRTEALEKEFSGALFQLGNRIGDGLPVEVAVGKVADGMRGTDSGEFFRLVDKNMRSYGMGLNEAIFNEKQGAIVSYPSKLIESSMKILIESARKGSIIAGKSMITISEYVNKIRQVNERLKDLLADVISSMNSQIKFMAPVIAGIVVGVGSMVVTIINLLGEQFKNIGAEDTEGFTSGVGAIANILNIKDVIPGFQFQAVVGIYIVEILVILTILSTYIEKGIDQISAEYNISKWVFKATMLYIIVSLVGIIVFNQIATAVSFSTAG